MCAASIASVQLARFDRLRAAGTVSLDNTAVPFCRVAADTRAAGTEPTSQQAFTFLILGLHDDVSSAHRDRTSCAPWLDEACEVWSGVLQPCRHPHAANYPAPHTPGPLFEVMTPAQDSDGPTVVLTTAGWR